MTEDLVTPAKSKTKTMSKALFILIIIISVFASCRSSKKIQKAIVNTKRDTTAVTITPDNAHDDSVRFIRLTYQQIQNQKINFITFSAKVNVDYSGADDKNYNVNAFIRMYRDSVIWVSINAIFGIEAMRAYITKDSVKLLDKQNKIYTARSVAYLQDVSALPLDLPALQELIIGNPLFLDSNIVSYTRSNGAVSLLSIGEWFKNLITMNENDKVIQHSKLDDADVNHNRTCDLTYSDYENKKGVNFSTSRKITVAEKAKLDVKLEFKQYSFNETLSFPFPIPKNYKRN